MSWLIAFCNCPSQMCSVIERADTRGLPRFPAQGLARSLLALHQIQKCPAHELLLQSYNNERLAGLILMAPVCWYSFAFALTPTETQCAALQAQDAQRAQLVLQQLGLRLQGLAAAVMLPTVLTALLFLGPLSLLALKWRARDPIEQLIRSPLEVCQRTRAKSADIWWNFILTCAIAIPADANLISLCI